MYQCRCDVKTACNDVIYIYTVVHYKRCDLHIVIVSISYCQVYCRNWHFVHLSNCCLLPNMLQRNF